MSPATRRSAPCGSIAIPVSAPSPTSIIGGFKTGAPPASRSPVGESANRDLPSASPTPTPDLDPSTQTWQAQTRTQERPAQTGKEQDTPSKRLTPLRRPSVVVLIDQHRSHPQPIRLTTSHKHGACAPNPNAQLTRPRLSAPKAYHANCGAEAWV
jgi:hypothetical protein